MCLQQATAIYQGHEETPDTATAIPTSNLSDPLSHWEGNSLDLQTWLSMLCDGSISGILNGKARYYNSLMTAPNLLNGTDT